MSESRTSSSLKDLLGDINIITGLITGLLAVVAALAVPTNLIIIAILVGLFITILLIRGKQLSIGTAIIAWLIAAILIGFAYALIPSLKTTVTGNIINTTGDLVTKLPLTLADSSGVDHNGATDSAGVFRIHEVPRGRYTILVDGKPFFVGNLSTLWIVQLFQRTVDVGTLVYNPPPPPTATPTQPPTSVPTALSTSTVSSMPTTAATEILSLTPAQILSFEDFETKVEGWGDKPSGIKLLPEGIERRCGGEAYSGNCWLQYTPTNMKRDVYLAREANESDTGAVITMFVKVPEGIDLCTTGACSTVRIMIWDRGYVSHESDFVELDDPGEWEKVELDLSGETFASPYKFIGLHFYIITDYKGPFYVDAVTLTEPQKQ